MRIVVLLVLVLTSVASAQTNAVDSAQKAYNPNVQYQLGKEMVQGGEGSKIHEGLALLRKSANSGNINAMVLLGKTLRESNLNESLSWYRQAAAKGSSESAFEVANILIETQIARGDRRSSLERKAEASQYLERAAKAGHKPSMRKLANFLEYGLAGVSDKRRAIELFILCGDYDRASYLLSQGEFSDPARAYMLARVSSFVSGNKNGEVKKLALKLTPQQAAQADRAFDQFIKQNKISPIDSNAKRAAAGR